MNKNELYIGITVARYKTKTIIQYAEGPYPYPKTDEDWNNLQNSIIKKFNKDFPTLGWAFQVFEIPKDVFEQYKEETKELFNEATI